MIEVADVPNSDISDDEELESEEESDEEDDDEAEAAAAEEEEDTPERAAARLEQLRLHRALGNDGAPEDEPPAPVQLYSEEEESSDTDSDDSVGVAPSDYTQYVRAPRPQRQRINVAGVNKLSKVDELRETVAGELVRAARAQAPRTKGAAKVGKAKGHKWKANASYQAGKDTGW